MAGKFTPILLILALAGSAISLSGSRLLAFAEPALVTKSWQLGSPPSPCPGTCSAS